MWTHAHQWYWLPEHHIMKRYVCHRKYDDISKKKNIEDVIKQVHKLDIQRGFNTMRIHNDIEFKYQWTEMNDIGYVG